MMRLLEGLPTWLLVLIGLVQVGIIGYADWATGDYSLLIFYTIPIFLVSWFAGRGCGLLICLAGGISRLISNVPLQDMTALNLWNSFVDVLFFLIISLLVSQLRKTLD